MTLKTFLNAFLSLAKAWSSLITFDTLIHFSQRYYHYKLSSLLWPVKRCSNRSNSFEWFLRKINFKSIICELNVIAARLVIDNAMWEYFLSLKRVLNLFKRKPCAILNSFLAGNIEWKIHAWTRVWNKESYWLTHSCRFSSRLFTIPALTNLSRFSSHWLFFSLHRT